MEKIFRAEQKMSSFNGIMEVLFKAVPTSRSDLVRIEELKMNGEQLRGWPRTFNGNLTGIEIDAESAEKVGKMAGRAVQKGKNVVLGVQDAVKNAYREAYLYALETREKLQEKALRSMNPEAKVKIVYKGRDVFLITDIDILDGSAWEVKTEKLLESVGDDFVREILGDPDDVDIGDYSIGFTWVTTFARLQDLIQAAEKKVEEIERKKAEKEAARKAELQAKFKEAEKTGHPVELRRWTTECNDTDEECDLDIVIEYAMPDGTTKIVRHHTW